MFYYFDVTAKRLRRNFMKTREQEHKTGTGITWLIAYPMILTYQVPIFVNFQELKFSIWNLKFLESWYLKIWKTFEMLDSVVSLPSIFY